MSRWSAVVPVRGTPVMTTGETMGFASKPGVAFIAAKACARPRSTPTTMPQAILRPCS